MKAIGLLGLFCVLAFVLISQPEPPERVGPLPDGGFLLNSGWTIRPAGTSIPVSTFPMSSTLSKDGRFLLVLNAGVTTPSISVIDLSSNKEVGRTTVEDGWLGLIFNPKGDRVYVGGGSQASVFEFAWSDGKLTPARTFIVAPKEKRTAKDFIGDVAFSPDGRMLYAADLYHDSLVVINPLSGVVVQRIQTGRRPYRILFHPDGQSFFVTSWADGAVGRYRASDGGSIGGVRLGSHPTDMIFRKTNEGQTLYVAAANTNSVYSVTIPESGEVARGETINVTLAPQQPMGMTPSALALSPDSKKLYVVCSNANAVAVVDFSQELTTVSGFIPSGWYPMDVQASADGRIVILNGRGTRSYPNPKGPNPMVEVEVVHRRDPAYVQYVGSIQTGTVSVVPAPDGNQLQIFTNTVMSNSPYRDDKLNAKPTLPAGIKHVIFIIKENRTYDQVLGDIKGANGDPSLVLFGENVTPNLHKIAREFVLLDNFYVNADVSADGHNWSSAAIANDYVEKLWPNSYGGRRKTYDYEGGEPAALPPAGYLWNNANMAGVSMRNYGFWSSNKPAPGPDEVQIANVRDPVLKPVTDLKYRAFDLDYPDVDRAREFLRELASFEQSGAMPKLLLVRMGNDHTSGVAPGKIAPLSAAADNDYGVGLLVEGVSKSKFWGETAIFIVEDDAQNGPDHVDSHRSTAYVISPFVKRRQVDHTMYNTVSVLRTMEAILGMRPMTTFDAGARAMTTVFQGTPDLSTFDSEKPRTPLDTRNPAHSAIKWHHFDLREADEIDDDGMNAELWQTVKHEPVPAPTRSQFSR